MTDAEFGQYLELALKLKDQYPYAVIALFAGRQIEVHGYFRTAKAAVTHAQETAPLMLNWSYMPVRKSGITGYTPLHRETYQPLAAGDSGDDVLIFEGPSSGAN